MANKKARDYLNAQTWRNAGAYIAAGWKPGDAVSMADFGGFANEAEARGALENIYQTGKANGLSPEQWAQSFEARAAGRDKRNSDLQNIVEEGRKALPYAMAAATIAGVPVGGMIGEALGGGKAATALGNLVAGQPTGLLGAGKTAGLAEQLLLSQLGGKTLGDTQKYVGLVKALGLEGAYPLNKPDAGPKLTPAQQKYSDQLKVLSGGLLGGLTAGATGDWESNPFLQELATLKYDAQGNQIKPQQAQGGVSGAQGGTNKSAALAALAAGMLGLGIGKDGGGGGGSAPPVTVTAGAPVQQASISASMPWMQGQGQGQGYGVLRDIGLPTYAHALQIQKAFRNRGAANANA